MRYFILFFLLTHSALVYSQFFVGDSKEDVKSALLKNNIKFTEGRLTDTTSRISWLNENEFQMIWVLNSKDIVVRQTLIPEKENGVNDL